MEHIALAVLINKKNVFVWSVLHVQYGNECWCGSSEVFADYDKHGEGTCHMPCSGDESVACGENRSHVFIVKCTSICEHGLFFTRA